MIKAIVNNQTTFEISEEGDDLVLNGELFHWDIIQSDRHFHIIHNHKSYNAELLDIDFVSKKVQLKIEGVLYEVAIEDHLDILLKKLGMSHNAINTLKEIKAPMPGLILQILVSEGMEIKKGDPIMVLEAMKMENNLKAPGEGKIKSIKVKTGQSVEKGQLLIDFV